MTSDDFPIFCDLWLEAHSFMPGGKAFSDRAKTMIFDALSCYPLEDIERAIAEHVRVGKFAPTPADISVLLDKGRPQHLGADEAWSLALLSMDDDETVILTSEIAQARYVAWHIAEEGDLTGARMAFRDAYNRLLASSSRPPSWYVSEGNIKSRIPEAVKSAVLMGRLPQGYEQKYLHLGAPEAQVSGLLEHAQKRTQSPVGREDWQSVKAKLAAMQHADAVQKLAEREQREGERLKFEDHRAKQLSGVADYVSRLIKDESH
jgi:hypothetical protein